MFFSRLLPIRVIAKCLEREKSLKKTNASVIHKVICDIDKAKHSPNELAGLDVKEMNVF